MRHLCTAYKIFNSRSGLAALGVILGVPLWASEQSTSVSVPETGRCVVQIWVRSTGLVQAAQVIQSSGAPRLDEACVTSVIGQAMIPATVMHEPVDQWVSVPIKWNLENKKPAKPPVYPGPVPHLVGRLLMDAPYYPEGSLKEHKEGTCGLHIEVSAAGDIDDLRVTKSTGDARLDRACLDVMYAADFVPPQENGKFVAGATDVYLAWRLPK
jgi:TonB family protein